MPGVVMRTVAALVALWFAPSTPAWTDEMRLPPKTYYRTATVGGHAIFYREAGDPARPTIVLLHGFPSTSHEFRELIPLLSQDYHVVAPDYLGSGYSDHPDPNVEPYTFDRLADAMQDFLDVLGLKRYTLYMTDFGGPVGFRLMERDPKAVEAIIVQNANCYLEGLTPARQTYFRRAHDDRSPEGVAFVYDRTGADSIINQQYLRDVPPERREIMNPDSWASDLGFLTTEKDRKIQVQLLQDYQNNIDRYPAWQAVLREHQFPALIVWGKNDQGFIAPGAEAYLRDLPHAELHLIDAGHFAVEEKPAEIAAYVLNFMKSRER
jgi:pimeloyl-ACP methyl ester carboxylesterase